MSAPQTVRSATDRLVVLTVLRWLPVGLQAPVTVLLAQSRGLSLAEIGLLFTVHGLVVVALELPTGGLADVLGRRPVVVAGAVLYLVSCLVFAVATSFPAFLGGILLLGVGRALDSGPVEAWYVDTVHRIDPAADVAPGLSRHSAADGGSLALGAVARAVPGTVAGAVRLSVSDGPMRLVLLLTAAGGVALVACELLGPLRFAELAGGADDGAAVYGTVLAVSFGVAAVGAMAAPALRRLLRGSTRVTCAALTLLGAGGIVLLTGPDLLIVAALGFAAYYLAHGSTWPLQSAVLHSRVTAAHRATAVSAMSLAMALGGILGNLAIPGLADAVGLDAAFLVVAVVVLVAAATCLRLPRIAPAEAVVAEEVAAHPAAHPA